MFNQKRQWPRLLLLRCISLTPKHEQATAAAALRKIAVSSVLYRAWSSAVARKLLVWSRARFVHPGIEGGVPGPEPADFFLEVAFELEAASVDGVALAGGTANVIKFFDRIPRALVNYLRIQLGAPAGCVHAWMDHLRSAIRFVRVRGGIGVGRRAAAGAANGAAGILTARVAAQSLPDALPIQLLRKTWSDADWAPGHPAGPSGLARGHLLACCRQEVECLIAEATADYASRRAAAARPELANLGRVDAATTLGCSRDLGDLAAGALFARLAGLVHAQKVFAKIAGDEDDAACPCGAEVETLSRRCRRCCLRSVERADIPEIADPAQVDDALATFGIGSEFFGPTSSCASAAPPDWLALRMYVDDDGHINFFSDGSTDPADDARWRVAGKGAVFRACEAGGSLRWRLWHPPLPGPVQTITRAELVPLVMLATTVDHDFRVWVDDKSVVDEARARVATAGRGLPGCYAARPNGDLWLQFDEAHRARPARRAAVTNIKAHTERNDARTAMGAYLWGGSDRADAAAKRGRSAHEGARDTARAEVQRVAALARRVQRSQLAAQRRMLDARSGDDPVQGDDAFGGSVSDVNGESDDLPSRHPLAYGSARVVELAMLYEIQTRTRLPVKTGPGKCLLPDWRTLAAVLSRALKEKGMLVQAVIKVLEQHGAGFAESPAHALSMRPQMHPRALGAQLETFFWGPAVRKSKLQMGHVFTTAPGGAPLIDVAERAIGADPLSERLVLHGSARSAFEQADLDLWVAELRRPGGPRPARCR
ncbi:unnamed protein product [Prorocentrum cordatum]|uniref:Uncharacterized protein n=1 Tax=Prorocentrum cordatum TaxID=2364126 RepID=A0ABN9TGW0_9DINO|nr:unnamed protein product [Polarella glacialis]